MYYISVEDEFSSAHYLQHYQGKCNRMHGHNWGLKVTLAGTDLADGMLIDFNIVKKELRSFIEGLDHKVLNETEYFRDLDPTAENLARLIYEHFRNRFSNARIHCVEVKEGKNTSAQYME